MTGFMRICPSCDRLCTPTAIFCIDCGTALVVPEMVRDELAKIRAETKARRAKARVEQGVRVGGSNRGRKARNCAYCGCRCYGVTCARCRDLLANDRAEAM